MDEARARDVLGAAGVLPGPARDARLLALGENAVFAAGDLVVKVGRDAELLGRARRELDIAVWLEEADVPAVRAAEPKALLVEGHPVTVWHRLPDPVRPAEPRIWPNCYGSCTPCPRPPSSCRPASCWAAWSGGCGWPATRSIRRTRRTCGSGGTDSRRRGRADAPSDPGPIHGDALPRNVHVGPDGPVLVDLETFSADLREHDLVVMALSRDRYGLPAAAYDSFVETYGWDVRDWEGCSVLRGARETASCAWVSQHAPSNPKALAEFERRVASLREGDEAVRWYPF